MARFDDVVVSDLHLGARNSRSTEFLRFLDRLDTHRLIIAGDLFDDPWLRGLTTEDVRVMDALRAFAKERDVVFLLGNHDPTHAFCRGMLGSKKRRMNWKCLPASGATSFTTDMSGIAP